MGSLQDRIQLRIEWWIQQFSLHFQDQRNRVLVSYNNNKEFLHQYSHSIWIRVNSFIESNDAIQLFIKRFKTTDGKFGIFDRRMKPRLSDTKNTKIVVKVMK